MPKKTTNDKSFLKFAQKKYNISDKEMAESEIWIDGFQNALAASDRVGAFAKWKPIPDMNKISEDWILEGFPLFVICNNDGVPVVDVAWYNCSIKGWVYSYINSGLYKTPTHYAMIEYPKNTPLSKEYKHLTK